MLILLSLLCLILALSLLLILSYIDLKTYLLPNIYVAPFALLGVVFHTLTDFTYLSPIGILGGGLTGFGILYSLRYFGNRYYGQESLGLGDVKLLGAAGLWLGYENVLLAMTAGAFAGLLHGILYAIIQKIHTEAPFSLRRLMIPAGPGFAVGIIVIGTWMYKGHIASILYDYWPSLFS